MDWNQELLNSALWLLKAYAITLVGFAALIVALARFTVWGRQFWAISGGYFSPKRSWKPLAGLALMLLFVLFAVRMNVLFSYWYNGFYSALQGLDQKGFWFYMKLFAILATVHVARALLNAYIRGSFTIHWRTWLNARLVDQWMDQRGYYLGRFVQPGMDNPEQRIQQDVTSIATDTLTLGLGLVQAAVSIFAFTGILWGLSAPMHVWDYEVPRAMVFLVYIYVIIASVFAFKIGRPLIQLNFLNEKLNASYRYVLMRVREYGENVALYRGEAVEKRGLFASFAQVIANAWAMLWRGLKFDGYNLAISQVAVIFPFLIQAPRLFTGQIKLGDVMQTSQAFDQVQDALSFFRTSYDAFATYRAALVRLDGFQRNMAGAAELRLPALRENPDALEVDGLTVQRPDGKVLAQQVQIALRAGDSLLIRGPSGAGKTTLLRSLAGLWPFAQGSAARPGGDATLFLSQKPYLPIGSLRDALAYPSDQVDAQRAREILGKVQLGHLADRLESDEDWALQLSPGEQQRLAFGRVLANRPALVFLDEATSAVDTGLEHSLYTLLRQELPQTMVVSVGHRETLLPFHASALTLKGDGTWSAEALSAGA
ncbi:ABC transporter ATP-binding protein/permease [Niveibacterium sp. SC-1]|uniref:ABC transporter ATP-binding protein/permease n=1 Tax=Niveibacterium sp. SC-1 TaxID=3135646 RepID=UPI0031203E32